MIIRFTLITSQCLKVSTHYMVDLKLFYLVTQSCPTLLPPYGLWWLSMRVACSLPGSSVHAIFQARILEWVAIPFSRGFSWPRDQTWVSCIAGRLFTVWTTRKVSCLLGDGYLTFKTHFFPTNILFWKFSNSQTNWKHRIVYIHYLNSTTDILQYLCF